jgi:hypothetical protein
MSNLQKELAEYKHADLNAKEVREKYLRIQELFMRMILQLDNISIDNEQMRNERKEAINIIQKQLDILDEAYKRKSS